MRIIQGKKFLIFSYFSCLFSNINRQPPMSAVNNEYHGDHVPVEQYHQGPRFDQRRGPSNY